MKKLLSVVIALMMMVTFVFAEEAAPAEVKTLYAGVLTVGCEAGYPPFEMVADDGESVVGLDMDIMAAVAEKLGLQMQVVTTSFDGIFDGIGVNYDVVCSAVTITPDRMQNMLFSLPYITNYQAVVVPADKDVEINSFMDLDGYVIGVEGAAGADLNDVYYVTGVYCEESRYNAEKFTWYAQAVSLADGSASDIELDETDADNALKSVIDDANKDAFTAVKGLYTFDDDVATAWDGDRDYTVYGINEDDGLDTSLKNALAMDDTKFSTTGGSSKTFYVDENTQYLGVDDYADDIDTVYAMGGMKTGTSGNVIVVADQDEDRDALYVILVDSSASVGSADILYAAGSSTDKVGTDKYVREFWSMEDNTSEDITIDEKLSAHGFYEVDSIDEDGVYTLKDYDKTAHSIDEDSDGIVVEDLALDNTDQIYRNALSGTIDNVEFDDVSIANATIIDGRSRADRNDSVYDREINSISRLEAALDAVRDEDLKDQGTVEIDLYVKDGEITFICVTDVGGVAKDDGEQGSSELDLTGVENFACNNNIVTVDLVGTGKIPANYPVTVTLMKANSTEGDAEVGFKEHVNQTAYEVNDWNNLGQIAIQESGNYYVIITIENEDGRVVDEFTSNTVRFVYTVQP